MKKAKSDFMFGVKPANSKEPTVTIKISPRIECLSLRNIDSFVRIDLSNVKKMILLKADS